LKLKSFFWTQTVSSGLTQKICFDFKEFLLVSKSSLWTQRVYFGLKKFPLVSKSFLWFQTVSLDQRLAFGFKEFLFGLTQTVPFYK